MKNIENWVLAIVQFIVSIYTTILGFVFKKEIARIDNLEKNQLKIMKDLSENYVKKSDIPKESETIKAIKNLEIKLAEEYVTKEEMLRIFGGLSNKVDKIYDLLIERR